jgi:hypothetical protein
VAGRVVTCVTKRGVGPSWQLPGGTQRTPETITSLRLVRLPGARRPTLPLSPFGALAASRSLRKLTHLYLQNNQLTSTEGIQGLESLSKLYLQGNHISLVSGLHNLPSLEELHLSKQVLPPGQGLSFDLHSMLSVSPTLRILTCNECGISDEAVAMLPPLPKVNRAHEDLISPFPPSTHACTNLPPSPPPLPLPLLSPRLPSTSGPPAPPAPRPSQLQKLEIAGNCMEVVECLEGIMGSAQRIKQLDAHNNPFCRDPNQRQVLAALLCGNLHSGSLQRMPKDLLLLSLSRSPDSPPLSPPLPLPWGTSFLNCTQVPGRNHPDERQPALPGRRRDHAKSARLSAQLPDQAA